LAGFNTDIKSLEKMYFGREALVNSYISGNNAQQIHPVRIFNL